MVRIRCEIYIKDFMQPWVLQVWKWLSDEDKERGKKTGKLRERERGKKMRKERWRKGRRKKNRMHPVLLP